jgi:RND family efflux transporter MFP subunit
MEPKKKIIGLGALVVGAVLFMLWLAGLLTFGKIAPGTVALKAPPIHGEIFTVQEVAFPRELTVMGTVISKTLAQVSSQVPGRVTRVLVEAGARVKKGAPLVNLAPEEYQAKVNQAQAAVARARAHLTQTAANYQRYRYLFKEGAASPQEFEAMEAVYKAAQAETAQAQAQLKEAATLKGYTVVEAPRAAVVAERLAAVGDLAQPGQPLVSLYNPGELQIEGIINDDYRRYVHLGLPVRLEVPAFPWQGQSTLAEIFPISETGSRTFKVRTAMIGNIEGRAGGAPEQASLPTSPAQGTASRAPTIPSQPLEKVEKGAPAEKPIEHSGGELPGTTPLHPALVPGMFARMYVPLGETRGYLIPLAAVRQVGQLAMVEVVVEGRPTLRQVTLGRRIDQEVEVLAGLQTGDKILISPEKK